MPMRLLGRCRRSLALAGAGGGDHRVALPDWRRVQGLSRSRARLPRPDGRATRAWWPSAAVGSSAAATVQVCRSCSSCPNPTPISSSPSPAKSSVWSAWRFWSVWRRSSRGGDADLDRARRSAARSLLAFGLTFAFAVQISGAYGRVSRPAAPKGHSAPLVSYGKTDLLVTLMSVGLLLNLSREVTP